MIPSVDGRDGKKSVWESVLLVSGAMASDARVSACSERIPQLFGTEPDALLTRVRGEYQEMPGLRLTFAQACRLWQMEPLLCDAVLDTLVREQFLFRTLDGAFIAASHT
jgi:hypothetical protein